MNQASKERIILNPIIKRRQLEDSWVKRKIFFVQWEGQDFELPRDLKRLKTNSSDSQQFKHLVSFLEGWYSDSKEIEQFTSGSTSQPKKILLDKNKIEDSANRTVSFFALDSKSIFLVCLGLNYIAGKMQLARAIVSGAKAIIVEPDMEPLKNLDCEIDFATMVPAQLSASLDQIGKVKDLLLGGGSISDELLAELKTNNASSVWIGYGMTETYSHIALRQLAPISRTGYTPMSKVEVFVDADSCLKINDRSLDIQLETRDIVQLDEDGDFRVLGRADFVINSGGRKIQPEVIERILSAGLEGEDFLISSVDHAIWGQELILMIASVESGDTNVKVKEAIELIEEKKDRPKRILFIKEVLRTWNGKLDRKANRELAIQILSS